MASAIFSACRYNKSFHSASVPWFWATTPTKAGIQLRPSPDAYVFQVYFSRLMNSGMMDQTRARIKENEIGRLHYIYQVRYKEECNSGKIPSRLLALNEEYAALFKQRGYTEVFYYCHLWTCRWWMLGCCCAPDIVIASIAQQFIPCTWSALSSCVAQTSGMSQRLL